jgi:outer membrane protein TolC
MRALVLPLILLCAATLSLPAGALAGGATDVKRPKPHSSSSVELAQAREGDQHATEAKPPEPQTSPASEPVAENPVGPPAPDVESLVAEALANNPMIAQMQAMVTALRFGIPQARAFNEPRIQFGIANWPINTFSLKMDPMTMKMIGLSQMFMSYGKRDVAGRIAESEIKVAQAALDEQKIMLAKDVRMTYWQIYMTERDLAIVNDIHDLLGILEDTVTRRYAAGQGMQSDVLKAQTERASLLDKITQLESQRTALVRKLNTLLGRPVDAPIGRIADPEQAAYDLAPATLDALIAGRPYLAGKDAEITRSRLMADMAMKETRPDYELMLQYGQRSMQRDDMITIMGTINLPIFRNERQFPKRDEALAMITATEQGKASFVLTTKGNIAALRTRISKNDDLFTLYSEGLIPKQKQTLDASIAAYSTGQTDLLMVLDNMMKLFDFEMAKVDALADKMMALAELEGEIGAPIPTKAAAQAATPEPETAPAKEAK